MPYGPQNWVAGVDARGQPIPREDVEPTIDGAFFEGDDELVFAELTSRDGWRRSMRRPASCCGT